MFECIHLLLLSYALTQANKWYKSLDITIKFPRTAKFWFLISQKNLYKYLTRLSTLHKFGHKTDFNGDFLFQLISMRS
jgi:hypothetical protein